MMRLHVITAALTVFIAFLAPGSGSVSAGEEPARDLHVAVYYFHWMPRCNACITVENLSAEVLEKHFGKEMEARKLTWKTVNMVEKSNEHFMTDYALFGNSLVISALVEGKVERYRILQRVWEFIYDEERLKAYVKDEVLAFLRE